MARVVEQKVEAAWSVAQVASWAVARAAEEGMVVTRVEAQMEAIRARAMVAIQVEGPGQRHEGRREAMAPTVARMEATAQRAEAVLKAARLSPSTRAPKAFASRLSVLGVKVGVNEVSERKRIGPDEHAYPYPGKGELRYVAPCPLR